jgi:DNA repair protein RadC
MHTAEGHRDRVKRRFREEGLDHFDEVHVLELVLFYAVPRKDTKGMARALLDQFGSLTKVLEADAKDLENVEGIGENVATFLNLLRDLVRYYSIKSAEGPKVVEDLNECGEYLKNFFVGKSREEVYLMCLDAKCAVQCIKKIGEGSVTSTSVSTRKVMEVALAHNAASVILAHNHPGGYATPSGADVATTRRISMALESVGIRLVDHIVVSGNDFVSMAQSSMYGTQWIRP